MMSPSTISDIFIQHIDGIPYIAKCLAKDVCIKNPNHSLITGFFSAINAFKHELRQNQLKLIGFDELSLVFDSANDILVVLGVENSGEDLTNARRVACDIRERFESEYKDILWKNKPIDLSKFNNFEAWLDEYFEVEKSMNIRGLFENLQPSFWKRVFSRFSN